MDMLMLGVTLLIFVIVMERQRNALMRVNSTLTKFAVASVKQQMTDGLDSSMKHTRLSAQARAMEEVGDAEQETRSTQAIAQEDAPRQEGTRGPSR